MKHIDVAIIGGGPIGGYVGKEIAKKGFKVTIFEEHSKIGTPLSCAGLVSSRVLDVIDNPKKIIQNEISGAYIHSPNGEKMAIGGDRTHAYVVNRTQFDREIISSALRNGATLSLNNKIINAKKKNNTIYIQTVEHKVKKQIIARLVIGADGPHSNMRKIFQFPQPLEYLRGIGAEISNVNLDPSFVQLLLGTRFAPGFFAWIIPTNSQGSTARIGLCIPRDFQYNLKQTFSNLLTAQELRTAKISKYHGGTIPLGPLKQTVDSNIMLVGDAAAQVKPTSGGGLYPGLLCAKICAAVAVEALEKGDLSKQFLQKYHKQWVKEIGRELALGMRFRSVFKQLEDKQLDKYLVKINNEKTQRIICKYGDIDYPSKLGLPILKNNPSLLKLLPAALKPVI